MSTNSNNVLPRGLRNNNPLNIRKYDYNDWYGKITDSASTDQQFEQFRDPKYGFRAAFILIHRYIKNGYKSVRDIITRWAPPSDGNYTESYIKTVCDYAGFKESEEIIPYNYKKMSALVEAMFYVENGVRIYELPDKLFWYEALNAGYDLYVERFVH